MSTKILPSPVEMRRYSSVQLSDQVRVSHRFARFHSDLILNLLSDSLARNSEHSFSCGTTWFFYTYIPPLHLYFFMLYWKVSSTVCRIIAKAPRVGSMTGAKSKDSPGGARCSGKLQFSFKHNRRFWEQQLFLSLGFLLLPSLLIFSSAAAARAPFLPTYASRGPFTS